jgi:hypothetical protein
MDIRKKIMDIDFFKDEPKLVRLINALLIISIIFGFFSKYLISQSVALNSDSVYAGIASHEIWVTKNFFLVNFYAPQVDPYYFTDIYSFQLIPQILTNFNPMALIFVSFCTFCLIIGLFGYLLYKITRNLTNSLIFAALVTNLTPLSYYYYADFFHVGTVALVSVLLVLLINFPESKLSTYFISLILLLLIVISDSLVLIWFVLPALIYYFYIFYLTKINWSKNSKTRFKNCNTKGLWFVIVSLISVYIVNAYSHAVPYLTSYLAPLQFLDPNTGLNHMALFTKNLILLYNGAIYNLLSFNVNLSILDYFTIIASIILALYSIIQVYKNIQKKMIIFCLFSILTGFLIFSFTNMIPETRYLIFYGILIFALIAFTFKTTDKIFIVLILCVLVCNGASNLVYMQTMNKTPNQGEYELIEFLESNNLTFGLADYWDSNIITYLSNGRITIRAVVGYNGEIGPFRWLAAESWYGKNEMSRSKFILVLNTSSGRPFLDREKLKPFLAKNPPDKTLHFHDYDIYSYN